MSGCPVLKFAIYCSYAVVYACHKLHEGLSGAKQGEGEGGMESIDLKFFATASLILYSIYILNVSNKLNSNRLLSPYHMFSDLRLLLHSPGFEHG